MNASEGAATTQKDAIPALLAQISPDSPAFISALIGAIQDFSRKFPRVNSDDERWSLIDCGLRASDWEKILRWAKRCPPSQVPRPDSRTAGVLLLLIGAAVARSLEKDESLWHMVADASSEALRATLFGHNDYPIGLARDAFSETCESLGLRHQLNLPGKHRYWRTVQLQFGFSAKVGAERLAYWISGYGIPEAVKTLLDEGDPNGSQNFRKLWDHLRAWSRRPDDVSAQNELRRNPWYPAESHDLIKTGLTASRGQVESGTFRIEDEDALTSLFSVARYRDGLFHLGLSNSLPKEITRSSAAVLRMSVAGVGWSKLVLNDRGGRDLDVDSIRIGAFEALQSPVREVKVLGLSGTLYRERIELWPEDQDFVFFKGANGKQVRDLARFTPEAGRSCALVARSEILINAASGPISCIDRSDQWVLFTFPSGLPSRFTLALDSVPIWCPGTTQPQTATLSGASFLIREISLLSVRLSVRAPSGWEVSHFRFGGLRFEGSSGLMEVSPAVDYTTKKARVIVTRGEERRIIDLDAELIGGRFVGAASQNRDGKWWNLTPGRPLDAGLIEGQLLAAHWNGRDEDDPWLTLGCLPLIRQPHLSRRQQVIATGEPLQLRFGLMNEVRTDRIQLASTVYSTGILAEIHEKPDMHVLVLRERIEAAPDLRVWVWEQRCSAPRLLPNDEVEIHSDNQTITILQLSAPKPIGWAVSLDGNWRGARFHVDPDTQYWPDVVGQWTEVLAREDSWEVCAAALRWWRFPVFMEPFSSIINKRVPSHGYETLNAWIGSTQIPEMALTRNEAEFFTNPVRTLLWGYRPSLEECNRLWAANQDSFAAAFETGQLSLSATLLLISHPVLLARIICELLWTRQLEEEAKVPVIFVRDLFCTAPDPVKVRQIEDKYRGCFRIARSFLEKLANYGTDAPDRDTIEVLRTEALSDLKSWTDSTPLDEIYFLENVVKPAEALFDQRECDSARLRVAVTRSRACCAFLVSHLLKVKGIRDYA